VTAAEQPRRGQERLAAGLIELYLRRHDHHRSDRGTGRVGSEIVRGVLAPGEPATFRSRPITQLRRAATAPVGG
jgi:hypothetical protein